MRRIISELQSITLCVVTLSKVFALTPQPLLTDGVVRVKPSLSPVSLDNLRLGNFSNHGRLKRHPYMVVEKYPTVGNNTVNVLIKIARIRNIHSNPHNIMDLLVPVLQNIENRLTAPVAVKHLLKPVVYSRL